LEKFYHKKECEGLLRRKMFITNEFKIKNGVTGLYDYGPSGVALKANIEKLWRNHFVLEDEMLEVSYTCLTPEDVSKASVRSNE
jgi:glycyl-tRNA synthetase